MRHVTHAFQNFCLFATSLTSLVLLTYVICFISLCLNGYFGPPFLFVLFPLLSVNSLALRSSMTADEKCLPTKFLSQPSLPFSSSLFLSLIQIPQPCLPLRPPRTQPTLSPPGSTPPTPVPNHGSASPATHVPTKSPDSFWRILTFLGLLSH